MEGVTSFEEPLWEAVTSHGASVDWSLTDILQCRNMHWGQFLAVEYVREY